MNGRVWMTAAAMAAALGACGGPGTAPVGGLPEASRDVVSAERAGDEVSGRGAMGMAGRTGPMHRRRTGEVHRRRAGPMHRCMMGSGSPGDAPGVVAAPGSAVDCPDIDQELVERGREVFAGAGSCFSCHGGAAGGSQLGPDLTDGEWLNVDGSYGAIAEVVRTGVSSPERFPAPMPPMGGASLSRDQVCSVAAYIYSLSES